MSNVCTLHKSFQYTYTNSQKPKARAIVPENVPKFLQLREMVSQPVIAAFCAGGVAGAVSRTVVSPLERLKILYQIQSVGREEYKLSVGKGLMKMWREEGWRGFMRGNGTNCIRIVPYSAVQFGSYNFYKRVGARQSLDLLRGTLLIISIVFRAYSRWRTNVAQTIGLWWHGWNYVRLLYLSVGYRPHATFYTVCFICGTWRRSEKKATWDVGNASYDVQN